MKTLPGNFSLTAGMRRWWLGAAAALPMLAAAMGSAAADLEQTDLKFGFIKLTDSLPVIIAQEKGFFEEE